MIAYPIKAQGASLGSIGIIGPKRMNYQKIVPLVGATAMALTRLLKRIVEKDKCKRPDLYFRSNLLIQSVFLTHLMTEAHTA